MTGIPRAPLGGLPPVLRGCVSFFLLSLNTVMCASLMMPPAVLKLIVPIASARRRIDPLLNSLVEVWAANNDRWLRLVQTVRWEITGMEGLQRKAWYLVVANHQSWADIFVMQKVFSRRIPVLKFFLKRELMWVPFAGLAWWALDFPFMKRHSEQFLREHPERRGEDLKAIRQACEKFSLVPTAVMTFLEGTRFTKGKHDATQSPYDHLLRPKAGGIALALSAMGEYFHSLVDVTIHYPQGVPTFFDFLSGKTSEVVVHVAEQAIPGSLLGGDYGEDLDFRTRMQTWVNELWSAKDRRLQSFREASSPLKELQSGSGRQTPA
ncbi:MAG: acyltransferase [Acidobacteriota bacterium]